MKSLLTKVFFINRTANQTSPPTRAGWEKGGSFYRNGVVVFVGHYVAKTRPLAEQQATAAEQAARALKHLGVTRVFGITGGSIMGFFDALYREGIDIIMFRHEQGAAHAADAYGRIAGRPGVVLATSGPGATNLVTGIANAFFDSSPMLAITGQVPTNLFGRDAFQETDIVGVTSPITKYSHRILRPEDAPRAIRTAYKLATLGRPGPTLVDFPRDIQLKKAPEERGEEVFPLPYEKYTPPPPDPARIEEAARLLASAERPVLLVGNGVYWSRAWEQARRIAEELLAPIVTTLPGKNAVSEEHPLVMGPSGMHGRAEADAALANADVVLAVGTRFSDRTVGRFSPEFSRKTIIHVDADASELGKNVRPTVAIRSDARRALEAIAARLEAAPPSALQARRRFLEWLSRVRDAYERAMEEWEKRIRGMTPWRVMKELRRTLPRNTITVTGVGSHQMWAEQHWRVLEPGTWVTSAGLGTMGFCLPAAIGAKFAAPQRPVLCLDGDGSFQMTMNNLAVAVDYEAPVATVVFDNRALMLVKQWQIYMYGRRIVATHMTRRPDFVKIAEAYDVEAFVAEDLNQLVRRVDRALRTNESIVAVVEVDNETDIVLPWVKPGDWLEDAILPPGMEGVSLRYEGE